MLKFYFHTSPNPMKVALFLEEAGLPYDLVPVDTFKGAQHDPAFRALNPNAKVPVIVDDGRVVFDSNAILLYLGDKTGQFVGTPDDRGALLSWLMFVASGLGPYNGQAVHFQRVAPKNEYAINRYRKEAERHLGILETRLAERAFLVGADYTLVDMAAWAWVRLTDFVLGEGSLAALPNLSRWLGVINARPAVARVTALGEKCAFKHDFDEDTLRNLFPQNYPAAA